MRGPTCSGNNSQCCTCQSSRRAVVQLWNTAMYLGNRVLRKLHCLTGLIHLVSEKQVTQLSSVGSCFNNSPTSPMDLAKTEESIYYSRYMEEAITEDPSYDLNKRQLVFPGTVSIPLHWFSPKSHGNTKIWEGGVFFQWILISFHFGWLVKAYLIYKIFLHQCLRGHGWPKVKLNTQWINHLGGSGDCTAAQCKRGSPLQLASPEGSSYNAMCTLMGDTSGNVVRQSL